MSYSNTIETISSLDTGSGSSVTAGVKVPHSVTHIGLLVKVITGNITALVLNIQVSDDGIVWYESSYTSGAMSKNGNTSISIPNFPFDHLKLLVGTRSSVSSFVQITVVGR